MTPEELIAEKLNLTNLQLEATTDAKAIVEFLRNTLDVDTILFAPQAKALDKLSSAIWTMQDQIEELTQKNSKLAVNNSILAGISEDVVPEITEDEKEYNLIMNSED